MALHGSNLFLRIRGTIRKEISVELHSALEFQLFPVVANPSNRGSKPEKKNVIFLISLEGPNPCFKSRAHTGKTRVAHGLHTGWKKPGFSHNTQGLFLKPWVFEPKHGLHMGGTWVAHGLLEACKVHPNYCPIGPTKIDFEQKKIKENQHFLNKLWIYSKP